MSNNPSCSDAQVRRVIDAFAVRHICRAGTYAYVGTQRLLTRTLQSWHNLSLAKQFLLAGGFVAAVAAAGVGMVVNDLIVDAVTRNSAATTAQYVDSVIAPILPDMRSAQALDDTVSRALDETLGQGALGQRLLSFRLWRADGTILYSNEKNLVGKKFEPNPDLQKAFSGVMVANFDDVDDEESERERRFEKPLLEIYNPVLQPWSGDVVAVSEFYEVADGLATSLQHARLLSWLAVVGFTLTFFLALSAIVLRGSRTIEGQRHILSERIRELSLLLEQNKALRDRVQKASQRTTALNESYLRRIGADLHDGPAQLIAYASLRLDSDKLANPATPPELLEAEITSIRTSLADAMTEIRTICSGLVLPQIETGTVSEIARRAVRSHEQRTGTNVQLRISGDTTALPLSAKICIYRFIQEALSNAFRHGGGLGQAVSAQCEGDEVVIEISDSGSGFDPLDVRPGSLGIAGLRERIESLGGRFELASSSNGTTLRMSLSMLEMEKA